MEERETQTNIGEIIYQALTENCIFESEPWAMERIDSIMKKFRKNCGLKKDYKVVIPWYNQFNAFTASGSHIFFARKLFQECSTDAMAAFIIAHEIAHHKLGHLDHFPEKFYDTLGTDVKLYLLAHYHLIASRLFGPEQECDADRLAIEMCVLAGYDPFECLEIFDKLEKIALDYNDPGAVFGPSKSDDDLGPNASKMTKFKIWLYQRKRGYLPIRVRQNLILDHLRLLGIHPETPPHKTAA